MTAYTPQELAQALERCATEPIHQIGQIPPHGALVVIDPAPGLPVLQASANLASFLGQPAQQPLGRPLAELLGDEAATAVQSLVAQSEGQHASAGALHATPTGPLQVRVFPVGDACAVELIPDTPGDEDERAAATIVDTQRALLRIEEGHDLVRYLGQIADLVRKISGFDRVMIYRFDANWDGEVIAESRGENVLSYLGTRFPASDIPPQARRLYTRNRFRLVVDVEADPVPVQPALNPRTGAPLDLTLSTLRSFSPVHVEYLRNMGVKASMSISLLQNGRLWGLVACHHMSPRQLPASVQDTAARISQIASSRLTVLEAEQRHNLGEEVSATVGLLLKYVNVDSERDVLELMKGELLRLFDATGLIVVVDGKVHALGDVPDGPAVDALLAWLGSLPAAEVVAFDDLPNRHPPAQACAGIASGLMASPVAPGMRQAMIWLRPERTRTVRWAGSPEKTLHKDEAGLVRLSPRKSFESWMESWRGRSDAWSTAQTEAAAILSRALTEGMAQKSRLAQARAARQELEHRYSLALQATNDGIWDWNLRTGAVVTNPAFSEMLGYAPGELGTHVDGLWVELLHPDERAAVLEATGRQLREAGHYQIEFRLRGKDGRYRWILSRGTVLERDANGLPLRAIGTHVDLTARKHMETELREARDRAEAANRAKSLFLATMSHELRTPLNGVIGMTELVRRRVAELEARHQLDLALQAGRQLSRLIDELLDVSSIESGRLTLNVTPFLLGDTVAEAVDAPRRQAAAKGLEFRLDIDDRLRGRSFQGDPLRLGQVLGHLVGNAVKFTERGQVAVRVTVAQDQVTALTLRFEVEDSGVGIPAIRQPRLFSLFEQGDGSTTRRHGGTGLGLVLSQQLVRLMGGRIGMSSREGQGSLFWFTLTLGVAEPAGHGTVTDAVAPQGAAAARPPGAATDAPWDPEARVEAGAEAEAASGAQSSVGDVDVERLRQVCAALLPMIERNELLTRDLVEAHRVLLQRASPVAFQQLRQALRAFDYDAAERRLRAVMSEHGIDAGHG